MHTSFGSRVVGLACLPFFTVHAGDIDDATPAFFHHIRHHLFSDVEHRVQVGINHLSPVFRCHFQKHTITGDTGIVHQHVNAAMLSLGLGKCLNRGIPITHIARRGVEGIAQSFLLIEPLLVITRRATTCDHFETLFVQALANCRPNATHATRNVCNSLTHLDAPYVSCMKYVGLSHCNQYSCAFYAARHPENPRICAYGTPASGTF